MEKPAQKRKKKAAVNWDEILPQDKSSDAEAIVIEDQTKQDSLIAIKRAPKLLILDFNKGWWSGLGKGTHEYIVDELKKEACGSDIEITYLYLKDSGEMNQKFDSYNKESFDQIWILSDSLEGMSLSKGEITSFKNSILEEAYVHSFWRGRSEIANLYAKELNVYSLFTDVSTNASNIDLYKPFNRESIINLTDSKTDLFKNVPMLLDRLVQES